MTTPNSISERAPVVLITGANKGLGRETARQLAHENWTVYLTARNAERGREAAGAVGAHMLQLDVKDDASVNAAADVLQRSHGRLDVLINNAAYVGDLHLDTADVTADDVQAVYETNVLGLVRVTPGVPAAAPCGHRTGDHQHQQRPGLSDASR